MSDLSKLHRRKFVTIRVTSDEKEQFEKIASVANKDVSTYVRELVLAQSSN